MDDSRRDEPNQALDDLATLRNERGVWLAKVERYDAEDRKEPADAPLDPRAAAVAEVTRIDVEIAKLEAAREEIDRLGTHGTDAGTDPTEPQST